MIKVCSLDFLNREVFDADIMSRDGRKIISSGDKITPGILLGLYFKELYVEKDLFQSEEVIPQVTARVEADNLELSESVAQVELEYQAVNADTVPSISPSVGAAEFVENEVGKSSEEDLEPKVVEFSGLDAEAEEIEPHVVQFSGLDAEVKKEAEENAGPRVVEFPGLDKDAEKESEEKAGPRSIEFSGLDVKPKEKVPHTYSGSDFASSPEPKGSFQGSAPEVERVVDENLKFDEAESKKIAMYSVLVGKELGMSEAVLKELEQAAYYHKIGITRFKQADLSKKNFKLTLAEESYKILLNEMVLPEKIAEVAKFYLRKYESGSFNLLIKDHSSIPFAHIVAITSYYSELRSNNHSKEEALMKMLRLGGNKFNIFILHKFIKKMRDANE